MTDIININDIGTELQIDVEEAGVVVDISAATTLQMILVKPSGTQVTKTASYSVTASQNRMIYTTVDGDIDEAGVWKYYGRVTFSPTRVFSTVDPQSFTVNA